MNPRVRTLNSKPFRPGASYVLYWSQMNRRVESNHALAQAIDLANERELPVLVYEGVTCAYPHANDRLHTFILEGVPDTAADLRRRGIGYVFYPRKTRRDPNDVLYRLASRAAAVVTDDYPTFIAATHNASVPDKLDVPYLAVDSSCVVPMSLFDKRQYAAYTIRPRINRLLPEHLRPFEVPAVRKKFKDTPAEWHFDVKKDRIAALVATCDIDHSVQPSTAYRGGSEQARRRLDEFLNRNLKRYDRDRNEPSAHATSGLSPYLHFGHISSLQVAIAAREHAERHKLIADGFLEELIVRRELAFNFARHTPGLESFDGLPDWARQTLRDHARDKRPVVYSYEELETGSTHDPLWNATQKELLLRGKIHGYYRMYWGKKAIEWSRTHEDAHRFMIGMHDRYALDGRDPNTYTNVLWCFGLHDRAWSERPIFGKIRYMSTEGMKRKTGVDAYLQEIADLERSGKDPLA